MKKFFTVCAALLAFAAFSQEFAQIRAEAKKVKPLSDADYKLGEKLMAAMKEAGMKKKLVTGRRWMFTEPVTYRSGRLYYTVKKWFDHNIFAARDMWEDSPHIFQTRSISKSLELIRMAGLDGFTPILAGDNSSIRFSHTAANEKTPHKMKVIPRLHYGGTGLGGTIPGKFKYLAEKTPWMVNGKPVSMAYRADGQTPAMVKKILEEVKEKSGHAFSHIHGVGSVRSVGGDPWHYYLRRNGVPATLMLRLYDKICEYLRVCDGVAFHNYLHDRGLFFFEKYYDDIILPLYTAACARPEFNGKKLFGLQVMAGYCYYLGSQTLTRDGTKTLRKYLELCRKYPVDVLFAFEWDETNEDTCLEPTVCKPMSSPRILRYYSDLFKGKKPVPFPGDDLSLPNLIISTPRQYILGREFDLELLNVPDTDKKTPYTVTAELLDHRGRSIYKSGVLNFDGSVLKDHTIKLPAAKIASVIALTPKVTIVYKGKKRVISEGLPSAVVRPTVSNDYSYLCTPVRNLLFPSGARVEFSDGGVLKAPMVRKVTVKADLHFPKHPLNMVEVVQNSNEIFSWDPKNEFLQNDPERQLFRFATHYMNIPRRVSVDYTVALKGAPSAVRFIPEKSKRYKDTVNVSVLCRKAPWTKPFQFKGDMSLWMGSILFSVKKSELARAEVVISGVRTSGPCKGEKFSCTFPLSRLGAYGVESKIFEDGIQFGVETLHRPELLPLPLNSEKAAFTASLVNDLPQGVLMLRAVSRDGRVWWSKPYVTQSAVSQAKLDLYHENKGPHSVQVSGRTIPVLRYKFDPAAGGNVLSTDAGREFYASLGGLLPFPVGFEGASFSSSGVPLSAKAGLRSNIANKVTPMWKKLPGGQWGLYFDGRHGRFIAFPPTVVPQRAGFTIDMELQPEEIMRPQLYFAQCGPGYITGIQLRTEKGKFVVDYRNRRPHDHKSSAHQTDSHMSDLAPVQGKWNKIRLSYNGRKITLTVNGKSQSFAQQGISEWLTMSGFGGSTPGRKGTNFFKGTLKSLVITHQAL